MLQRDPFVIEGHRHGPGGGAAQIIEVVVGTEHHIRAHLG